MRLKVGLDGKPLLPPQTGVFRYTQGLLSGLASLPPEEVEVVVVKPHKPLRTLPWVLWHLQRETAQGFKVFHFPFYYTPLVPACPVTVAVHDVLMLHHPHWFRRRCFNTLRYLVPLTVPRADGVITGTQWVAEALEASCGVPRERIRVIPYGVDRNLFFPPPAAKVRQGLAELGLGWPYLLMVGALEPRRGVDTLVAALTQLRQKYPELHLVLVGPLRAPVEALVEPPPWVHLLGQVEDRWLPLLYAGAEVVVAPSRGEGFDLPVLEALACGACVVASDIPVHREVFAGAVQLFRVGEAEGLAQAVRQLLEDRERREHLRAEGLSLVQGFSWERAARAHLQLWRELT
ncbi:MAG: glycosyltransferase family 4 protein [Thermoanaerobaculum sp.]|nr:glycosyltransferase family 4 protein [Thermoanaerobaculum sp.]MDW7968779.1 glycosyltransferase family 1 protein [Thermoanaerobaculum sp.]